MKTIYLILGRIFGVSGIAFRISEHYDWDWLKYKQNYRLIAKVGKEFLLAFAYQYEDTFLFLCENNATYNKESQMPCAAILKKEGGYRSYNRVKNLRFLTTKEGRDMNFRTLNGDDHDIRRSYYSQQQ